MTMIERRIKELSIAIEALSRVNDYYASQSKEAIQKLLDKLIDEAKEMSDPATRTPPRQPVDMSDDIPF